LNDEVVWNGGVCTADPRELPPEGVERVAQLRGLVHVRDGIHRAAMIHQRVLIVRAASGYALNFFDATDACVPAVAVRVARLQRAVAIAFFSQPQAVPEEVGQRPGLIDRVTVEQGIVIEVGRRFGGRSDDRGQPVRTIGIVGRVRALKPCGSRAVRVVPVVRCDRGARRREHQLSNHGVVEVVREVRTLNLISSRGLAAACQPIVGRIVGVTERINLRIVALLAPYLRKQTIGVVVAVSDCVPRRRVTLAIAIDHQYSLSPVGDDMGNVVQVCRFSNAALVVKKADCDCHTFPFQ